MSSSSSPRRSCSTCVAFAPGSSIAGDGKGTCRYDPPKLLILNTANGPTPASGFPPVKPDDWCSQWIQSEQAELEELTSTKADA